MTHRSAGAPSHLPLNTEELERIKTLLRLHPNLTADQRRELMELHTRARATELMALMSDPELRRKLRRFDPPADFRWDLLVAWTAVTLAAALVLWLIMMPPAV